MLASRRAVHDVSSWKSQEIETPQRALPRKMSLTVCLCTSRPEPLGYEPGKVDRSAGSAGKALGSGPRVEEVHWGGWAGQLARYVVGVAIATPVLLVGGGGLRVVAAGAGAWGT